ncbi:asparagine synthase (glutamine-hydrolyzing) [Aliarcobacter cryaerophilus]|uniref:asparagine synthase (glutamine-hydrolyzing) n=1 Tax=Aliarcobacter cryaerophilus TaxID=28198 RepID=UPI0021B6A884|nr:asparagine synthase (glutamine-hydrolyzing) [Aliarcobacter cryaerophilus]MCT7528305.1 asparagine synthase (glutamine-hydrolyzing) [Aliarcobacter cryaerophilus]
MCGIFGTTKHLQESQLNKLIDTLEHRGPDDRGLWTSDDINLGHRRLAIIDVSHEAHQPMSDLSNRYQIVYNGELYNYIELRQELVTLGIQFKTNSDTEVVLNAYIHWGEKALNKFNGMWAFAIWDCDLKRLFLSRDRIGEKPLFYIHSKEQFSFASEMKALYPLLNKIIPNQTSNFFSYGNLFKYEATSDCIVEDIKRFPAGYYGYYQNDELEINRYWNVLENLVDVPNNYNEQVEMFQEIFNDAVKLRMRADVPIATSLSGGIDSSAIYATALNHIKKSPCKYDYSAYSAVFENGGVYDESDNINKIVNHTQTKTNFIKIDVSKSIDSFLEDTYLLEDFYLTCHIPMIQLYQSMKNDGIKVSIDGHGADELFAGYGGIVSAALSDAKLNPFKMNDVLKAYFGIYGKTRDGHGLNTPKWKMFINNYYKNFKNFNSNSESKFYETMDRFTHKTVLPTLLRNYDRYSMSQGVEVRMPFLDHRLISFAFSLPWHSKVKGGFAKSIVRDSMKGSLPNSILYDKSKVGFSAPLTQWIRNDFKEIIYDTFYSSSFKSNPFINPKNAQVELSSLMKEDIGSIQLSAKIWSIFSLHMSFESINKFSINIEDI